MVLILRFGYLAVGSIGHHSSNKKNSEDIFVCRALQLRNLILTCFCCVFSWGRGHPEEYTEAINIGGEEKFDVDSDKKPRAGQILWIRGLTRLQTQVSKCTV